MSVTKPQPAERPATDAASERTGTSASRFSERGRAACSAATRRYLDDLGPNALIAAFVRSPHAHARITGIDTMPLGAGRRARDSTPTRTRGGLGRYGGEPAAPDPHPAITAPRNGYTLAKDEVNHVGEAIAMVVADNRYIARTPAR
ncbi:hypothetical protein GS451_01905 [Rhodococcus hoagii]|nr:hypothetical protein [Prescottella equi]